MKKRIVSLLFAALFILACLFPFAGLLITGGAEAGANEVLAARPSLTGRDGRLNAAYLSQGADYVADRFFLRQEAVTLWAKLNAALFRTSVTESVVLGNNGWLYYEPTLPDYTRSEPMTGRELWCAARTLYLLQEYARGQGAEFLFTVAPNKNSLYDENMPALARMEGPSNAQALHRLLDGMGVAYLDLFAVFEAQDEVLFFAGDSHWNGRGAALAGDAILAALGRESGFFAGPFAGGTHTGDLYEMLYPAGKEAEADFVYAPGFTFAASSQNPDNPSITARGNGEGRLLCYRDSFGRNLYPYLAESFAESVFSRKNDYAPGELSAGDCLVVELVERNLRYLNANPPTLPAAERTADIAGAVVQGNAAISFSPCSLQDYVNVRGNFTGLLHSEAAMVYIEADGVLYEAVPLPGGFSACIPGSPDDVPAVAVYVGEDGNLFRPEIVQP